MTTQQTHTRDIPAPKYKVLLEEQNEEIGLHIWHVKTHLSHVVKVNSHVEDGKVKPPEYGETNYVTVTARTVPIDVGTAEKPVIKTYSETTVYASDEKGDFYNAPMWVTKGIFSIEEAMFAIGEI